MNLDGVPIADIGGRFDFSNLSTAGVGQFEVYRGPNSVLYGSDATAGVVSLTTPRGSTPFPSFFYEGDAGSHTSFRNLAQLGGTYKRLDYYGGFDAFQSDNAIKMNEYHDYTAIGNLGYAYSAATQFRVTARNSDAAVGTPGAFNFYGIANAGKQSDQDIYLGAAAEHWTLGNWHNLVRYGMTRKREEDINFYPAGIPLTITSGGVTSTNYYGYTTGIRGANGYSVTGQALLNFAGTYPNTVERVNNRDQVYFQSDYPFTPHILGMFAFRYEDERGAKKSVAYGIDQNLERANYDYTAQIQGSYRNRLFYSLGGGAEKNQLFGTVGTPESGWLIIRSGRVRGSSTAPRSGSTSPTATRSHRWMNSSLGSTTSFSPSRAAGRRSSSSTSHRSARSSRAPMRAAPRRAFSMSAACARQLLP